MTSRGPRGSVRGTGLELFEADRGRNPQKGNEPITPETFQIDTTDELTVVLVKDACSNLPYLMVRYGCSEVEA